MTCAEGLSTISEIDENNVDTENSVWLVHPANAETLGSTAKDSGPGLFVCENVQIVRPPVITMSPFVT